MLGLLVLMLGLMWFWKSNSEEGAQPAIAYSQLYKWIEEGKVVSVVLDGDFVDATLKSPEALDGRQIRDLRTSAVANDPALLPLLHQKGVKITVKSQKQPFALQMLFTLLPWALIIGAWRGAQGGQVGPAGDRAVSQGAGAIPPAGRQGPARRSARGSTGHRQDAARARRRG